MKRYVLVGIVMDILIMHRIFGLYRLDVIVSINKLGLSKRGAHGLYVCPLKLCTLLVTN
jgi:hypothetical protein